MESNVSMKEQQIRRRQALKVISLSIREAQYFDIPIDDDALYFLFELDKAKVKDVLWIEADRPLIKMSLYTDKCGCYYLSRKFNGKTSPIESTKDKGYVHEVIRFSSREADVELDVKIELIEGQDQIFHDDVIGGLYTSEEYQKMIEDILTRTNRTCEICGNEMSGFTLFNKHNNNAHCYSTNPDHYIVICDNCRPQ